MSGPLTKNVTLPSGLEIKVHRAEWACWVRVKTRLMQLLKSQAVGKALQTLFRMWEDGSADAESLQSRMLTPEVVELLPELIEPLGQAIDELTEDIVRNCVRGELPESIDAIDMIALRDAACEVTDWAGLLSAEKNSLLGVFNKAMANASSGKKKPA